MSATFEEMEAFARQLLRGMLRDPLTNDAEWYVLTARPSLIHSHPRVRFLRLLLHSSDWVRGRPVPIPVFVDDAEVAIHIERASVDPKAFDGLMTLAAAVLERGDTLPPALCKFSTEVLRGRLTRPRSRGGRRSKNAEHYRYGSLVRKVSEEYGLSALGYGGDYTGSAVAVVCSAARAEGEATTLDAVANAYKMDVRLFRRAIEAARGGIPTPE